MLKRLWPYRCVLCGGEACSMDLCPACSADLPWLESACRLCATPWTEGDVCPGCCGHPPLHSACVAAFIYEYPLDRLISALKFRHQTCVARICAELLVVQLSRHGVERPPQRPHRVVPVPLHKKRARERGFNQAEIIAATLCRLLRLPHSPDVLERTHFTQTQTSLTREQRLRNLRGVFAVRQPVANQRIALVDDVITTGATSAACVAALHRAGAADVQVWAVARAIRGAGKYS